MLLNIVVGLRCILSYNLILNLQRLQGLMSSWVFNSLLWPIQDSSSSQCCGIPSAVTWCMLHSSCGPCVLVEVAYPSFSVGGRWYPLVLDDPSTVVEPIHPFYGFMYGVERGFFTGSSWSLAVISIHCCLGTSSFSRERQCQGHEGEGKKDQEYCCMFGNRANDVG
jgi:hypothetical protein